MTEPFPTEPPDSAETPDSPPAKPTPDPLATRRRALPRRGPPRPSGARPDAARRRAAAPDATGAGPPRPGPEASDPSPGAEAAASPGPDSPDLAAALEGIAAAIDEVRQRDDRIAGEVRAAAGQLAETVAGALGDAALRNAAPEIADQLRVLIADLSRERDVTRRRAGRIARAVPAAALAAALVLGAVVQHRFAPIPVPDPTAGWRDWLWAVHGESLRDCTREAIRTGRPVDCGVVARPRGRERDR